MHGKIKPFIAFVYKINLNLTVLKITEMKLCGLLIILQSDFFREKSRSKILCDNIFLHFNTDITW